MSEGDSAIEEFLAHRPFRYCSLVRLEFCVETELGEAEQVLTLELDDAARQRLVLTFKGVDSFEFRPNLQNVPVYLEIVSTADRKWQSLFYQVFNTEQDVRLSFYCREFTSQVRNS